ncbi:cytochrome c [Chachezhania sediminis]|uniref:cytochrome c n=1 Tax=Chachezhania sediminis TaxID=2599291 RepID=UPI00131C6FA3|nr:cytochrome c [Chachezhania sediminis]
MIDPIKRRTDRFGWQIRVVLYMGLALLMACGVEPDTTDLFIDDERVQTRVTDMIEAQTVLDILTDMLAGKTAYDKPNARYAQKELKRLMADIPRRFRRERGDPLDRAEERIWHQWDDFLRQARIAEDRARDIEIGSRAQLRTSLGPMLIACQSCHDRYRTY